MKKIVMLWSCIAGLSLTLFASAQDQIFAERDFLDAYDVQSVHAQCVANGTEEGFLYADCVIDAVENQCIHRNASMTEGHEAEQCNYLAYRMWDVVLNDSYGRLMDALPQEKQALLRDAQRAWLAFHEKDDSSITAIWQLNNPEVTGTVRLLFAQMYRTNAIRDRTEQLYESLASLEPESF